MGSMKESRINKRFGSVVVLFDPRTTRQADEGRSTVNNKPYRNKDERKRAREFAKKIDGTYYSSYPRHHHTGA